MFQQSKKDRKQHANENQNRKFIQKLFPWNVGVLNNFDFPKPQWIPYRSPRGCPGQKHPATAYSSKEAAATTAQSKCHAHSNGKPQMARMKPHSIWVIKTSPHGNRKSYNQWQGTQLGSECPWMSYLEEFHMDRPGNRIVSNNASPGLAQEHQSLKSRHNGTRVNIWT